MIIDLKCLILLIWYKNSHKILEKLMKRDTYIEWNIWQFKIELMIHGLYMLSVKKYLLDVPYLARDKYLINLESSVPTEQDSLCLRNIHVPMYWVPWYACSNHVSLHVSLFWILHHNFINIHTKITYVRGLNVKHFFHFFYIVHRYEKA